MTPRFRLAVLSVATAALVAATTTPAQAGPDDSQQLARSAPAATSSVDAATDRLAREVAGVLADPATRARVARSVTAEPVDLLAARLGARVERAARSANQAVLEAKGLPAVTGSVLRLRLGHQDMAAALAQAEIPLVAAAASDDALPVAVGYEPAGGRVQLDPARLPDRPVLVVEVDVAKAMTRGLAQVRQELTDHGLVDAGSTVATRSAAADSGYWATKVNEVRLSDDQEPWIKGSAEIFSIVTGFGQDGKGTASIVEMPYLDHDGETYRPNQLLVHFDTYKYDLADVVMYEDDGGTNYRELARSLITALLTVIDYGVYVPLVSAIIDAMPDSWWIDDPDYVDSFYTLSTSSSGRLTGASGNGWLDVAPYWVQPL
ncbi:DUF3103 family protein [Salinispora arenicola]|uniref:DUF3103 family protein n=1 Tax=Salinispora arenicola TaxID=168697 RepID=UPI00207AAD8B|nr:DUF3103 family protein [Salinispora arenicola]MCN0152495.1 DUF3103 domain-containing protein [Salinispora arenicola]